MTSPTVFKWRKRYLESGIEGLNDLPRSVQPLKLGADKVREILTLATQRVPNGATHWSVRLMANTRVLLPGKFGRSGRRPISSRTD
ncbi:transposase [Pseudomonas sp. BG2dil]|nr:transposase [Pseudomonas sp. M2]